MVETPDWTFNAPTLKIPEPANVIGVDYVVLVIYRYHDEDGWHIAERDAHGSTSVQIQVWGTDFVVVPVTSGNSYS